MNRRRGPWVRVRAEAAELRRQRDEARSERDTLRSQVRDLERPRTVVLKVPAQSFGAEPFAVARDRAKRLLDDGIVVALEFA